MYLKKKKQTTATQPGSFKYMRSEAFTGSKCNDVWQQPHQSGMDLKCNRSLFCLDMVDRLIILSHLLIHWQFLCHYKSEYNSVLLSIPITIFSTSGEHEYNDCVHK